ncbi:E3 SUMO-protein ligase NSE2-like isoform X2 [Battus philenor]|uniref:E3 SUMO-protein ligase NSE2-like isoform X2 n=1 Tax=Battus philenor TaxID=42288 RepID=UPI0035D0E08B
MADAELTDLRKQCLTSLYSCAEKVSMFLNGQEKETEYSKLKSSLEEYCLLEARQDYADQAMEKAKSNIDSKNLDSLHDMFHLNLNKMVETHHNVNQHPYMIKLNEKMKSLDESDLAITETQEQYIDPITKRPIKDPVKNSVCGHIYERESIKELINMRKTVKCPVAGCGNTQPLEARHVVSADELRSCLTLSQHDRHRVLQTCDLDTSSLSH